MLNPSRSLYGRNPLSRSQARDLLEILDDHYGRCATMVVTQALVADLHNRIPDPTISVAVLDHPIHNAYSLELEGESMRKVHSPLHANHNQRYAFISIVVALLRDRLKPERVIDINRSG